MTSIRAAALSVALTAVLAGCGGADGPVPDVVGDRLDVAKSTVEDAGYETDELGGGTFGIVDESNWIVCETRPAAGETSGDTVKLIVDRSCPDSESTAGADSEDRLEQDTPADDTTDQSSSSSRRAARVWVPDVVGMNHQAAQNRMQAAGLYNLHEEDATGQGRLLLYDRNWEVVSQSPAAGRRVSENRRVVLSSKKLGE